MLSTLAFMGLSAGVVIAVIFVLAQEGEFDK